MRMVLKVFFFSIKGQNDEKVRTIEKSVENKHPFIGFLAVIFVETRQTIIG